MAGLFANIDRKSAERAAQREVVRQQALIDAGLLQDPDLGGLRSEAAVGQLIGGQQGPFRQDLVDRETGLSKGLFDQNPQQRAATQAGLLAVPALEAQTAATVGGLLARDTPLSQAEQFAAQEQERADRIQSQQDRLEFGQDTQLRALDTEQKRFNLLQDREAAANMGLTGFKNPTEAIEFGNTANTFKNSIDSMSRVIKVREGFGNLSPFERQSQPELAAALRNFEQIDSVAMFKKIIDDPRTSDQDRDWYRNVIEHGIWDTLARGEDSVELNQLQEFRERLRRSRDILQISNPAGAALFPQSFSEVNLDEQWGEPYRRQQATAPPDFQPVGPFPGL